MSWGLFSFRLGRRAVVVVVVFVVAVAQGRGRFVRPWLGDRLGLLQSLLLLLLLCCAANVFFDGVNNGET